MTKKIGKIKRECLWCKVNPPKRKIKDKFQMIALDRPYINLWFHRKCYSQLNKEELQEFLIKNKKVWYK